MNRVISAVLSALVAAPLVFAAGPGQTAPIHPVEVAKPQSNVIKTQSRAQYEWMQSQGFRYGGHRKFRHRGIHGPRYYKHRRHFRHPGYARHWKRHHHPRYSYRRHHGVPAGAFIAGAIIGGALAAQPRVIYRNSPRYYVSDDAHVSWCLRRYRSYDIPSDTFQPYHGPRRKCFSPYG